MANKFKITFSQNTAKIYETEVEMVLLPFTHLFPYLENDASPDNLP